MSIRNILSDKAFQFGIEATTKESILKEIATSFSNNYNLDHQKIFDALWAREQKGSTGLGKGLAVPHARIPGIGEMKIMVFYSKEGRDFNAYDSLPSHLFFTAIIDEDGFPQEQLDMLRIIVETCEKTDLMTALPYIHNSNELKDLVTRRITEIQNS